MKQLVNYHKHVKILG